LKNRVVITPLALILLVEVPLRQKAPAKFDPPPDAIVRARGFTFGRR
jgi:hypothetical protein